MRRLRVVLVAERFWPLVGRSATSTANLAAELVSRHVEVTVLTARWQPRWPAEFYYGIVRVIRLPHTPRPGRKPVGFMRSLARWLRENQGAYDLVYVSRLEHVAYAALGAIGRRVPVVLRAERAGRFGDCHWQLDARFGRRIKGRCMQADALVAPTRGIERELIAAGYPRERIHYVPHGVPIPPVCDPHRKACARAAVFEVNPGLHMPEDAPLALYAGRLHEAKGLWELVAAWQRIILRRHDARLWLAGEGRYREALERQIADRGLVGRVFLVGVFDSVDGLLAAADLFISPSQEEGPSLGLLDAMAAGLPIVATDISGNREIATNERDGLLVPAEDGGALGAAIGRLWESPELAARLGAAARDRVEAEFSLARMGDAHLKLFEALTLPSPNQDER